MFPAIHFLVIHLNIEHLPNKIVPEVIFTSEENISDLVFELSNQNEPFIMCTVNVL